MFSITSENLNRDDLCQKLNDNKSGALVTFEGQVRDHNEGKKVSSLEYQIYEALALKEGAKILEEAKNKFNIHNAHAVHRFGHLKIKDMAVWIGVSATHRNDAYIASRYIIDEIKHRLPVWKKEHYVDKQAVWVFCKDHHHHVHFKEKEYYLKQNSLIEQSKLKNAKVVVIGDGGLGSPALISLVSAGVGEIKIIDFDKIEISNIHRQSLYHPGLVGETKVAAAVSFLGQLNPFIKVYGENQYVSNENILELIDGFDLILDCTDNLKVRYLIHDACFKTKTPLISGSIYKFDAQLRTFDPNKNLGCLRCINQKAPDDNLIGNCNDVGVISSIVNTLGSLQANEAILYLLNNENNTLDKTLYLDLKKLEQKKIRNLKNNNALFVRAIFNLSQITMKLM